MLFDVEQDLVKPLKQLAQLVEALTPDDLTARFAGLVADIEGRLASLGLGETLDAIDELFDAIVSEIQRVPLRRLRADLLGALASVEGQIRGFPGLALPDALTEQIAKIERAVDGVDLSAIQQKVDQFAAQINGAVGQFPIAESRARSRG